MSEPSDVQNEFAKVMMNVSEQMRPLHDMLTGEVAQFLRQGYTPQEALAMSAAMFVTMFGTAIPRDLPEGWILRYEAGG